MHALSSCCSTFLHRKVCAHQSPNIEYNILMSLCHRSNPSLHLVPNVDTAGNEYRLFLSVPAPLAAIAAPIPHQLIRYHSPFRCRRMHSLALCVHTLTLHYVFTAPKLGCVPTPQARISPQPYWRPSVLPYKEELLYCCHLRYPSQLSPRKKLWFTARSKPYPRHPRRTPLRRQTCALSFPSVEIDSAVFTA